MKQSILVMAMLVSFNAMAGQHNNQGATALAGASALSSSSIKASLSSSSLSNSSALGGSANNGGVEFNDRLQIPNAPGLSSGSSNTTAPHRIYKQRQVSTILGGWTNIDMDLDLVSFIGSKPDDDAQLAACIQSADFREYRRLKGNVCPN